MATQICINGRKAAYLMLEAGLDEMTVQRGINGIKQPSAGYYPVTAVMDYIREAQG